MRKSLAKVYKDRLKRQYERYPTLQALRPMNNVNTTFRKFYQQAKGLPFFRFDLPNEEHAALANRQYDVECGTSTSTTNNDSVCCCWSHLVSLPLDKTHIPKFHYHYQAYVLARLGIQINNDFLLSSFVEKFKHDLFTTHELLEFEKNNIPISDIHKRPLNKNIAVAKATNLGLTELMIRIMLYKRQLTTIYEAQPCVYWLALTSNSL